MVNIQSVLITPVSPLTPAVGRTQDLLLHFNCHCLAPSRGSKAMATLTQELPSPGLISSLAELGELLMECDIWAWIIYVNGFSFRSHLLAFCLVFDFPLLLSATNSFGCHLCNQLFLSVQKIVSVIIRLWGQKNIEGWRHF